MEARALLRGDRGQLRDEEAARERSRVQPARGLTAVEVALLERFDAALQGRVLMLGCSPGGFTTKLYRTAQELHGVCETLEELARCRRAYRHAVFTACDARALGDFAPRAFDAVLVHGDALDVLDDGERRGVLQDVRALLTQDGVVIFSSHNRDWAARRVGWLHVLLGSPRHPLRSAARLPLRVRNRRRLRAQERRDAERELRNDAAREFGALHYYVSRDAQERQLSALGYQLLECLDGDGQSVERSATAQRWRRLHYVARA